MAQRQNRTSQWCQLIRIRHKRACMRNEGTNLGCEGVWISIYMIRFVVSRYHKAINEVFCSVPFELERRPIL